MNSTRFDPSPGEPYGTCLTCETSLPDEQSGRAHMSETFDRGAGKGHTVRVTNPPRPDRISLEVDWKIDDAVNEAITSLDRLVERGDATVEEISEALRFHAHEFSDAWDEYQSDAEATR